MVYLSFFTLIVAPLAGLHTCYSKASSNVEVRYCYRLYEKKGESNVFAVLTKVIYIVEHYLTFIEQVTTECTV